MTALIHTGVPRIAAEVNWSRWIVRCPRCPSALAMTGVESFFECWECGQAAEIVWPPSGLMHSVARLLMLRPAPSTRNWRPGETLIDLMLENVANGLHQDQEPGLVLTTENEVITVDRLPAGRELLPAIGT